jgi:molecular chaperone GrpE
VTDTDAETKTNRRAAKSGPKGMNGGADAVDRMDGDGAATTEEAALDLAAVVAERDEYLDQLQRSRAEFANYRRRTEQERGQLRELVSQVLLAQFLPVLDDLQRALAAVPEDRADDPLVQGVRLIERKFWGVLERAGVSPIEAVGEPFDPALHEAVDSVPDSPADTVVDVYQTGYRLSQGLLRPAMVKVGGKTND